MKTKFCMNVRLPKASESSHVLINGSKVLEPEMLRDFISEVCEGNHREYVGCKFTIRCLGNYDISEIELYDSDYDAPGSFIVCTYDYMRLNPKMIHDFIDFYEVFYMSESDFKNSGKDESILKNYNNECYKAVCTLHRHAGAELSRYRKDLIDSHDNVRIFNESKKTAYYHDFVKELENLENSLQTYGERSSSLTIGSRLFTPEEILSIVRKYDMNIIKHAYELSSDMSIIDLSYIFDKLLED